MRRLGVAAPTLRLGTRIVRVSWPDAGRRTVRISGRSHVTVTPRRHARPVSAHVGIRAGGTATRHLPAKRPTTQIGIRSRSILTPHRRALPLAPRTGIRRDSVVGFGLGVGAGAVRILVSVLVLVAGEGVRVVLVLGLVEDDTFHLE